MQRFCERHSKPGNPSHTVLSPGKSSQEETLCSAIKLCSVPPPWSSPLKTLWESDWGLKGEIPGGNAVPWMGHSTHTHHRRMELGRDPTALPKSSQRKEPGGSWQLKG